MIGIRLCWVGPNQRFMFEMRRASTVHRHDHFKSYCMTFCWRLFENILLVWWALCQNQVPWTGTLDCIHRVRCNYLFLSLIPVSSATPSICICVHHPIQSYSVNKKNTYHSLKNTNVWLSYSGQAWAPFSRDFRIFLNLPGKFATTQSTLTDHIRKLPILYLPLPLSCFKI